MIKKAICLGGIAIAFNVLAGTGPSVGLKIESKLCHQTIDDHHFKCEIHSKQFAVEDETPCSMLQNHTVLSCAAKKKNGKRYTFQCGSKERPGQWTASSPKSTAGPYFCKPFKKSTIIDLSTPPYKSRG